MRSRASTSLRRSAKDTRQVILDVALQRLERLGPDGLRLKDLAREAEVSHPTILHHFGSRHGLDIALMEHVGERLMQDIVTSVDLSPDDSRIRAPKVDAVFRLLADQGYARALAWVFAHEEQQVSTLVNAVAVRVCEVMTAYKASRDGSQPSADWVLDLQRSLRLVFLCAVGAGIVGDAMQAPGRDEPGFRLWLSNLVQDVVGI